jgi:hypothetical protein
MEESVMRSFLIVVKEGSAVVRKLVQGALPLVLDIRLQCGTVHRHVVKTVGVVLLTVIAGKTITVDVKEVISGGAPPATETHVPHSPPPNALLHGAHFIVAATTSSGNQDVHLWDVRRSLGNQ